MPASLPAATNDAEKPSLCLMCFPANGGSHGGGRAQGLHARRAGGGAAPSTARVAPPCPHFGVCGGCHYQHSDYTAQLEDKRQILQETILRGAKLALPYIEVHSGEPYGFRNRTRMKIAVEPEFALGYYRHGSHELEAVRQCPISSPLINRAIALLWELAPEAASYPSLREVQFFANHDDSELLVELFIHHATTPVLLAKFAKAAAGADAGDCGRCGVCQRLSVSAYGKAPTTSWKTAIWKHRGG